MYLKKFILISLYLPRWCLGENMTSYIKMATVQEKTMCVFWFFEIKSVMKTQRRCRVSVEFTVKALGYGLEDWGIRVRFLVGAEIHILST
jgi:hypothetical protein